MEESLTNQAIAELMLEIEGPKSTSSSHKQSERKVNPLGKANKRFLGRTINTVIRHNRREVERTQAKCREKLKDLDDIYERRKSNYFYNRDAYRNSRRSRSRSRSSSTSRSSSKSRSRRRVKKSKKRRSRRRCSSSPSRSRSRSHRKNKKKTKKHRNSHHRSRRSSSSNSRDGNSSPRVAIPTAISPPTEVYLEHSKQMALAVAMAYGQVLKANSLKATSKDRESSPMSDIVKELMSDGEEEKPDQIDALSISSNDIPDNVLTIDVSSSSGSGTSSESSDTESEAASSAGSCIDLDQTDNNNSDIEIIESPYDKEKKVPEAVNKKQQVKENAALESVDLTED